jgi:hypothetical protein
VKKRGILNHLHVVICELLREDVRTQKAAIISMMMQFTPEEADTLSPMAAARFIQIENQLLMIIDLQLASNLPIVE